MLSNNALSLRFLQNRCFEEAFFHCCRFFLETSIFSNMQKCGHTPVADFSCWKKPEKTRKLGTCPGARKHQL